MKAGFFDPYLDTVGGGERYVLTLVESLAQKGWRVDLFWNKAEIKEKLQKRLALNLERVNFIPTERNVFNRLFSQGKYDLFFWLSDGSIPLMFSRKNLLHFQVPFHQVGGRSLVNQLKLRRIHETICNSNFTKKFIDKEYGIESKVIHPPIDVKKFKPEKKEKIILSVGRFSQLLQAKRQDVLISVFKKLIQDGSTDWKLVLAGATDVGGKDYLLSLRERAKGFPVEFLEGPNFETVKELYGKAQLFWSASGYGIDEEKEPEKVEHFGIVTVEAMAAGCLPLVVGKGGAGEIIKNGFNGFLWQEEKDLVDLTRKVINDTALAQKIRSEVVKSSQEFSKEIFSQKFDEIIDSLS